MKSHYEILKAMKTGFSTDFRTAIYARSISSKEYERYISGQPPLILSDSVGEPLVSWSITGNTVQDGEPSPESPIEVKGTGDKTGNLFEGVIENCNISSTGRISSYDGFNLYYAKVHPNTQYTISANKQNVFVYAFYNKFPTIGIDAIDGRTVPSGNVQLTITTPSYDNDIYICIRKSNGVENIMLNKGSEPLPYEPYGYKIPFVCKGDNLFNADQEVINGSISDDNHFYYSATASCVHIAVQPNTKYYITTDTTIPIFRIGESTAIPAFTDKFITTYRLTNANSFEITTNSNTHCLTFQGSTSLLDVWRNELNVSHYKPISTNIYLDSPLMADEVLNSEGKREVEWGVKEFTGDEDFIVAGNYCYNITLQNVAPFPAVNDKTSALCTHYAASSYNSTYNNRAFGFSQRQGSSEDKRGLSFSHGGMSISEFKDFLKSEYDAGHPVTVWYQLATPTSETVDVPQIPTISGNCSIDVVTTVKPTNMSVTYKSRR